MGSNLDPDIKNPKKRRAEDPGKKMWHRFVKDERQYAKNWDDIFGKNKGGRK